MNFVGVSIFCGLKHWRSKSVMWLNLGGLYFTGSGCVASVREECYALFSRCLARSATSLVCIIYGASRFPWSIETPPSFLRAGQWAVGRTTHLSSLFRASKSGQGIQRRLLALYAKGRPLLSAVSLLILRLRIKLNLDWIPGLQSVAPRPCGARRAAFAAHIQVLLPCHSRNLQRLRSASVVWGN